MWKEGLVDRNINSYYYIKIQKISEQTKYMHVWLQYYVNCLSIYF